MVRRILFVGMLAIFALALPSLNQKAFMTSSHDLTLQPTATSATADNEISIAIPMTAMTVTVAFGGDAKACNLILLLCAEHVPGMCDLYWYGLDENWW